jgi:hypothetical protein
LNYVRKQGLVKPDQRVVVAWNQKIEPKNWVQLVACLQ